MLRRCQTLNIVAIRQGLSHGQLGQMWLDISLSPRFRGLGDLFMIVFVEFCTTNECLLTLGDLMAADIFKARERALEDEFFRKVDDQLLQKMRDEMELVKQRDALAATTGITDEKVLDELVALNIKSETIVALWLFPLVWVAWADGHIDQQQRDDILAAAHESGYERNTAGHKLIESWLDYTPNASLKDAWRDYVRIVCGSVSTETRQAMRQDIMEKLERIADASSFHFDFDDVEKAQHAVIAEIQKSFESEES